MEFDNDLDQQFIASLDQLIEENMQSDNFDVSFISRQMGMSAPVLYRKLRAITNLSINNYVKIYRLKKAKELLKTSMNISEVAYAVGFSERKYFSREFKKQFGYNPSERRYAGINRVKKPEPQVTQKQAAPALIYFASSLTMGSPASRR
ncbi:helix-turn-helix domain-containing protein [Sphingobacterium thalpophilum]|uniref:Arabinose operon regulatory protein n=1 Tax=Sphingobacterium thalpophilum TaxID=259 RepID=A0A4U9US45_9SPHI|nr:AraC family transcriptional regulator [Sphingobacterium thalpophilum]VTR32734.1 Arabinose operon regulatory protein [Sphingobacterium thalpophilum]